MRLLRHAGMCRNWAISKPLLAVLIFAYCIQPIGSKRTCGRRVGAGVGDEREGGGQATSMK